MNIRDLQIAAEAWDACLRQLRYEDGTPVEVAPESVNPYRVLYLDALKAAPTDVVLR